MFFSNFPQFLVKKKYFKGYDKNGNKLDGTYKKKETGVKQVIAYNEIWKKIEGIFAESKDEI